MAKVSFVYTVTDSADSAALENVHVWATSDITGQVVVDGPDETDSNGEVTFSLENASTVYIWTSYPGYNADANPDTETVDGAGEGTMTAITVAVPDDVVLTSTATDLITDSLIELGVHHLGQTLNSTYSADMLKRLNRMLEKWRIDGQLVYQTEIIQHTISTTSQSSYSIGPSGDLLDERPTDISAAYLVIDDIHYPLHVIYDPLEWADIRAKTTESDIPNTLYCDDAHPNANLYLYPVPSAAVTLELHVPKQLTKFPATTTIVSLPEAYYDALMFSLAEYNFNRYSVPQDRRRSISMEAIKARSLIKSHNAVIPEMNLIDAGVPNHSSGRYDHLVGNFPTR